MNIIIDNIFWSSTLANALGTLMAAIISAIFVYLIVKPFGDFTISKA